MTLDRLLNEVGRLGSEEQGKFFAKALEEILKKPADARSHAVGMLKAAQGAMKRAAGSAGKYKDRDTLYADEVLDVLNRYASDDVES